MDQDEAALRLREAEVAGMKLATICRTVIVALAFLWFLSWSVTEGDAPSIAGLVFLGLYAIAGGFRLRVIGTPRDRAWLMYAMFAGDCIVVAAGLALLPLSATEDAPQILAFRAHGIYYLFPLIAMATLTLSWRLVIWTGAAATLAWWAAFYWIVSDMETVSRWSDMRDGLGYEALLLSPDFIGFGNRVEETVLTFAAALILALAVYRARAVFLRSMRAEAERRRASSILGQYVPEAVAGRLLQNDAALAPQERNGVALVLDIADFTAFAAARGPKEVIAALNDFLSAAAEAISARDGVVISFTGDGLLAAFNTPIEIAAPEAAARAAAADLLKVAEAFGFRIRIGLAAGPLAAGSVGSAARKSFTIYGDTVNLAARLEALAKTLGETVLADARLAGAGARAIGPHKLRGFPKPVEVYAPALARSANSMAK